ncbi:MAG TPA: cupredoxin family copper-binding protein [Pseudonocardiaceae bacterium]|jgi:plastocyanin|nr:cupredoxin family copper-binding protein [Pseudonocardiaceae bacterium]
MGSSPPNTQLAPPGTGDAATARVRVRRGLLGLVAAAALAGSVLALTGLAGGPATAPAPAAAPQVRLAAAQQGALQSLNSLAGIAMPAAAAAPAATPGNAIAVTIQNYAFAPASLAIPAGTTVVWTNKDTAPHTVTVSSGPVTFSSPNLQQGDTFTYTFTQPGTYKYYCAVHPYMTASVTVTGTTTPPPTTTTQAPPGTTSMTMTMPPPSGGGTCLVSGILTPFIQHVNSAHLGESLGQQAQDLLNLNQYVQTHTVLIENMLNPLTNGGLVTVLNGVLTPLVQHIDSAHLGESPGQQAQDLLNVDQYVKTHTVLIENMLAPLAQSAC